MQKLNFEGIVIKREKSKEKHLVVTLITKEFGKVICLARHVRSLKSKRIALLEPFSLIRGSLIDYGRASGLSLLTEVQLIKNIPNLRLQIGRMLLAYKVCEIIDLLTETHHPLPKIYDLLLDIVQKIATLGQDWQEEINTWSAAVLTDLGYLDSTAKYRNIDETIEEIAGRRIKSQRVISRIFHKD